MPEIHFIPRFSSLLNIMSWAYQLLAMKLSTGQGELDSCVEKKGVDIYVHLKMSAICMCDPFNSHINFTVYFSVSTIGIYRDMKVCGVGGGGDMVGGDILLLSGIPVPTHLRALIFLAHTWDSSCTPSPGPVESFGPTFRDWEIPEITYALGHLSQ